MAEFYSQHLSCRDKNSALTPLWHQTNSHTWQVFSAFFYVLQVIIYSYKYENFLFACTGSTVTSEGWLCRWSVLRNQSCLRRNQCRSHFRIRMRIYVHIQYRKHPHEYTQIDREISAVITEKELDSSRKICLRHDACQCFSSSSGLHIITAAVWRDVCVSVWICLQACDCSPVPLLLATVPQLILQFSRVLG